jgi:hypothetical protein
VAACAIVLSGAVAHLSCPGGQLRRLFERVLATVTHRPRPHRKVLCHLLRRRRLPGPVTCRHLSRDRPYPEKPCARHWATSVAGVARNKAALTQVVPSDHEQALGLEARFVPKGGQQTDGLARFWNGTHSRTEPGLASSARGWLDVPDHGADALSSEQTPPPGRAPDQELTRMAI